MPKVGKKWGGIKPQHRRPAETGDWPAVIRLAIGGVTMVAMVTVTGSVEAAVIVGSVFGAMTERR